FKAFTLVESSKSRALAELLSRYARSSAGQRPSANKKSSTHSARVRLQELIEDMNWNASQAAREDEAGRHGSADQYRATTRRRERQIAALFRRLEGETLAVKGGQPSRPVSAGEFCGSLGKDEAAIEYFIEGDIVSAFVAARSGLQVRRNITSKRRVEQMLSGLRFQMQKFSYGSSYLR